MNVGQVRSLLEAHPEASLHFALPDGSLVPAHFHVTEVGRVRKDFIDCGGTVRSSSSCVLQLWVADDTDHRLTAGKLAGILRMAEGLLGSDDLPVEAEHEAGVLSQYPVEEAHLTPSGLLFVLGGKHADCLAKEKCGAAPLAMADACAGTGCC
ncbi:MAG: hypothetical protein K2W96_16675 [Gemmataceae bacterium]|nr:hypothetical protein [Gemmataceae bacterium]